MKPCVTFTLHYITCHLADAFIQSDFQLSAFNPEGVNSRQQVVSASILALNKQNYKEPYENAASRNIHYWSKVLEHPNFSRFLLKFMQFNVLLYSEMKE